MRPLLSLFIFIFISISTTKEIDLPYALISLPNINNELSSLSSLLTDRVGEGLYVVTEEIFRTLQSLNVSEMEVVEFAGPLDDGRVEKASDEEVAVMKGVEVPDGYHSRPQIETIMTNWANQYPSIARLVDLSALFGRYTANGRSLFAIKISDNVQIDEDEPNVLFVMQHHAREIITPEIGLDVISQLLDGWQRGDPRFRRWIENYEIFVSPVWNPDGNDFVWSTNNMWRKNRRPNGGNIFGVDENRNYDAGWPGPCAGSTDPSSDTYKGPSAGSEPEMFTMASLHIARHFERILDFHSSGREVLCGYGCSPLPAFMQNFWYDEGTKLAQFANYVLRRSAGEGQHFTYAFMFTTEYNFLVETHTQFQPPYTQAVAEAQRVRPLWAAFLDRPASVFGRVTDSATNGPISARITVDEIAWQGREIRQSEVRFGRYHLFMPPGTYNINYAATGYRTERLQVQVVGEGGLERDIRLIRQLGNESLTSVRTT